MKHKPQSRVEEVGGRKDELLELGQTNKILVERNKHRIPMIYFIRYLLFYVELNVPFPQLYLFGIQIIWEWDDHQLPLLQRRIHKIHHIGRVPD